MDIVAKVFATVAALIIGTYVADQIDSAERGWLYGSALFFFLSGAIWL